MSKPPDGLLDRLKTAILRTEMRLGHKFNTEWKDGRWEMGEKRKGALP